MDKNATPYCMVHQNLFTRGMEKTLKVNRMDQLIHVVNYLSGLPTIVYAVCSVHEASEYYWQEP